MKSTINHFFCFLFLFLLSPFFSQNQDIDSLLTLLSKDRKDTNKLLHLYLVSDLNETIGNYDEGLLYGQKAIDFSDELIFDAEQEKDAQTISYAKKFKGKAYNNMALIYFGQGNYSASLKNHTIALEIRLSIDDKRGIASSYNNIGNIYYMQGNYAEAISNYFDSYKMREKIGDKPGLATSLNNIGSVYRIQNNLEKALLNFQTSLKLRKEIKDIKGEADSYNNIGIVFNDLKDYSKSLDNYFISLKIRKEIDDKSGISNSYMNIGSVYASTKNNQEALKYYFLALEIQEILGDKAGTATICNNIGTVLILEKKYSNAESYLIKAKNLAHEIGHKEYLRDAYLGMTTLDSVNGNFKGAFENRKKFILYRDSLDNEETRKKTIQNQMTYDFEKKEAVATAEHKKELEKQDLVANEKSRKQTIIILFVAFGLLLVLVFSGFIFRSLRITRKQKNIIEKQKNIVEAQKLEVELQKLMVEEHQKEIIDSIMYARRIQRSLLPSEKYIERNMKRLNTKKVNK